MLILTLLQPMKAVPNRSCWNWFRQYDAQSHPSCWSKWCSVVNKKVWCNLCLYQCLKPSKPLSKWKWCSVVDKTNQAASILPTEFGSLCIHAIDVTEDSIEPVQDLTSEGRANKKSETWPVKVKQTSEGDLTSEGWANGWRRLDPEECGKCSLQGQACKWEIGCN